MKNEKTKKLNISKLNPHLQEICIKNCLRNELVIIPASSDDVGFDEYFERKIDAVSAKFKLDHNISISCLDLCFPDKLSPISEVNQFFESPYVVSHNRGFRGVFRINITSYIADYGHKYFQLLKNYIRTNKEDIVYLLFVQTDNKYEASQIKKELCRDINLEEVEMYKPSNTELCQYIQTSLKDYGCFQTAVVEENLKYMRDYLIADRLISFVETHFEGNGKAIPKGYLGNLIQEFFSYEKETNGVASNIGY